jgi:hypothetical protein
VAYAFEGIMLEACSCHVICPCWAGQDPDGGTCEGVLAYHIDRGTIDGVDVAGLTYAMLLHLPGNVLQGNWRIVLYVDDKATNAQHEALLKALTGKLGGPLADIAQLVGEVAGVERAAMTFEFEQGNGRLQVGPAITATMESLRGATGQPMTMHDTVFSTIENSPVYVGKAPAFRATASQYGFRIDLQGHSAVQGAFRFAA